MANVYGVINTLIVQTGSTSVTAVGTSAWQTAGYVNGRVKVNLDYYACNTDVSATVIYMGAKLPIGAMVLAHVITATAALSGVTLNIGDLDSGTRYVSATASLQTAGTYVFTGFVSTVPYIIGTNPSSGGISTATATDNDQQIVVTVAGGTMPGSGYIILATLYVTD
jgi:hypothetical protein